MRRLLLLWAALLSFAPLLWAADLTILNGTIQTWHNGTGTLANNANVTSAAVTLTNAGYPKATCEFNMPAPSGTVAANSNVQVWFRLNPDGTNFEDATTAKMPDFWFPLQASAAAQRIVIREITLPAQNGFQVVIRNNGTGVTINTTWTLKCTPYTTRLQ